VLYMPVIRIAMISTRDPEALLEALREPTDLLEGVPGIINLRYFRDLGIYHFTITYRSFLATYLDTITMVVSREDNKVIYSSLEPNKLRAVFTAYKKLDTTVLEIEISYEPPGGGHAAMTTIEGIFRKIAEKAERKAERIRIAEPRIEKREEKIPAQATPPTQEEKGAETEIPETQGISCITCLLYEPELRVCTYFAKKVEDPGKPICKGEKYIRAPQ